LRCDSRKIDKNAPLPEVFLTDLGTIYGLSKKKGFNFGLKVIEEHMCNKFTYPPPPIEIDLEGIYSSI
jgi:hypothetical protein